MKIFDVAALLAFGLTNVALFAGRVAAGNWPVATLCFVVGCACLFQAGRISEKDSSHD